VRTHETQRRSDPAAGQHQIHYATAELIRLELLLSSALLNLCLLSARPIGLVPQGYMPIFVPNKKQSRRLAQVSRKVSMGASLGDFGPLQKTDTGCRGQQFLLL
jgi:hypothetical protein